MTKRDKYTLNDKIFAIIIVIAMCIGIIAIPVTIFCKAILIISKTNLIIINGTNNFDLIITIIKFMILTISVIIITALIFNSILEKNKGIKQNIMEFILMYLVILLYTITYSHFSINSKLVIKKEGILWTSIYLFALYILTLITFKIIEKLYEKIILKKRKSN